MDDRHLQRVLGVAAALGGTLRIAAIIVPAVPQSAALEAFYVAIDLLLLFGLMGVYWAYRGQVGGFGFATFVIAEAGIASIVGPEGVTSFGIDFYWVGVVVITLGLTLFAIQLLACRAGPPWAPLSWIASTVVGVAAAMSGNPEPGFIAGGALFGMGFVLAGVALVRGATPSGS